MNLSSDTVAVLKNFSDINQNILVKPGNKVQTISTMKAVRTCCNTLKIRCFGKSGIRRCIVHKTKQTNLSLSVLATPVATGVL